MTDSNVHVLSNFPPPLRKNIEEILNYEKIGISLLNMKLRINPPKKTALHYQESYLNNFVLEIPFAGRHLQWEIIFNNEDYQYPPDFDFTNDSFMSDPDVDIITNCIPSLAKWDLTDNHALINVVKELLFLYRKFQVGILKSENKFAYICSEFDALMELHSNVDNKIEVHIDYDSVNILTEINISLNCLPPYILPILLKDSDNYMNTGATTIILKVSFIKPDGSKVQSNLQLSPLFEQLMGNSKTLHLPNYCKNRGLVSYVNEVTTLLKEQVEQVASHYKSKNEYISNLLSICGNNILEYDNVLFTKASLLFSKNNFHILLHISLGNRFPQEKPKLTLTSVYNLQFDKPATQNVSNYPYSPRWPPSIMVKRLLLHLNEEITKFQTTCQQNVEI